MPGFPRRFTVVILGLVMAGSSASAEEQLRQLGVEVMLGQRVNALSLPGWRRDNESAHELTEGLWYRLSRFVMRQDRFDQFGQQSAAHRARCAGVQVGHKRYGFFAVKRTNDESVG